MMKLSLTTIATTLLFFAGQAVSTSPSHVQSHTSIPTTVFSGSSLAQYTSDVHGPDAPKISHVNGTVNGWWYFDVVSEDLKASVDVFLYYTPEFNKGTSALSVSINARFANGTAFDAAMPAEGAVITTESNGSNGRFLGTGFQWASTPDLNHFIVKMDSPSLGVEGTIVFDAVAPAHYPCTPIRTGETLRMGRNLGWANALTDSNAIVDLNLNGSALSFTGVGYHDQRWSPSDFNKNFGSWFWGHARLGPYSIVWYDTLSPSGDVENVSAFAARDNKIITAKCSGLKVRPTGNNSTYPPGKGTGRPQHFHINMDLGSEGTLQADVTPEQVIFANSILYTRWIGRINGTVSGNGKPYEGVALFEEANYLAV